MNKYDKKMMHEHELISDAEKQADAKGAIHRTDEAKKSGHKLSKHWHNNR
jgi:hypothetical protein